MINNRYGKNFGKDFFRLSILTLVTVIIWIGMTVYKTLNISQVKPEVQQLLLPLTPTIDLDTMEKIRQREIIPETDWNSLNPASHSATSSAR
ncbi:MAG: hypothetical protein UV54_C0003G0002 [Candidatus Beckwithbacteria bacterium GW2011_GWA2_43_10]|uniref:Uncharacterized protein n=1 Tax=Candidatus Beckwithbacteria bacterium GW2011_GWA2_43_10 TaxID=1618369 RepID=A0A0G1C4N7_9BACT|nr:MAG: hypothetical protein UV54_C0003G0002 [Candidatus Beckwithbacteria bacterium GW2011_GWA2_43_10]